MHVLMMPIGSYGDVHPYVGLGLALLERGHRVTVHACGYFRELFERTGLEFVEFGSADEYLELVNDPKLWHPRRGFGHIFEQGVAPRLREQFDRVADHVAGADDPVVLSSCLGFGARIAREVIDFPLVSVHLQPAVLWSDHESPRLGGMLPGPRWMRRLQFWIAERGILDRTVNPGLAPLRRELGLPPVRRTARWWHSPDLLLGLFPEWFAPRQPDWPDHLVYAGFPLWDEGGLDALPDDLESFLAEGDPPIVFTPGSANMVADRFFRAAVDATNRLGRRALLCSKFPEQIPANLPATIRHVTYAPFSRLFPRVAAVVHHGGIGTTAQCLRAGVPQFVMPMSHDQPDNAHRLRQLGVGDSLTPRWFTGRRVANQITRLLNSDDVRANCVDLASRFETDHPLERACEAIESVPRAKRTSAHENGPAPRSEAAE